MRCRYFVMLLAAMALTPLLAAPAAGQGEAPRMPWGVPDLQGVWDFRTITPLERPEELGDQEFLTAEEVANREQAAVDRDIRLWEAVPRRTEAGGNVGGLQQLLDGPRHECLHQPAHIADRRSAERAHSAVVRGRAAARRRETRAARGASG